MTTHTRRSAADSGCVRSQDLLAWSRLVIAIFILVIFDFLYAILAGETGVCTTRRIRINSGSVATHANPPITLFGFRDNNAHFPSPSSLASRARYFIAAVCGLTAHPCMRSSA